MDCAMMENPELKLTDFWEPGEYNSENQEMQGDPVMGRVYSFISYRKTRAITLRFFTGRKKITTVKHSKVSVTSQQSLGWGETILPETYARVQSEAYLFEGRKV